MSSNVKTVELGEIVDITSSKRIFRKEYVESGIPFYRGKEIIEKSSGNEPSTDIYITEEKYNEIKEERGVPKYKDVLLTSVGTLGVPYQVQENEVFYFKDGNLTWIKDFSEDVLPEYIYVWLKSPIAKEQINRITIGSTQQALTITSLKTLKLELPPLYQQKRVCDIYYGFSDKIRVNQQTNVTLEAMAQAIFKSWFVDFDPVRAKIEAKSNGRDPNRAAMAAIAGISIEQDWDTIEATLQRKLDRMSDEQRTQLRQIAELFPDELVESEIGVVPRGWGTNRIDELGEIITGKTPPTKSPENYGDDVPFLTIPDMHGNIYAIETSKYLSKIGADIQKNKYLSAGSISMSCIASPGLVVLNHRECHTNQQINTLIPDEIEYSIFYFFLLRELSVEVIMKGSGGSVFKNLNKGQFSSLEVRLPEERLRGLYNQQVKPLMEKILLNEFESQSLSQLRDTLLPKLISGEVEV